MEKYKPKKEPYIEKRRKLLINSKNFYDGRKLIIDAFKNKIFPMVPTGFSEDEKPPRDEDKEDKKDGRLPTIKEESSESEGEDKIPDISTLEQITELDTFYERDLICKYYFENSLIKVMKKLKDYKKNPEKLQMYNNLITRLNIGLKRLVNDINNTSEDEVEDKKIRLFRGISQKNC